MHQGHSLRHLAAVSSPFASLFPTQHSLTETPPPQPPPTPHPAARISPSSAACPPGLAAAVRCTPSAGLHRPTSHGLSGDKTAHDRQHSRGPSPSTSAAPPDCCPRPRRMSACAARGLLLPSPAASWWFWRLPRCSAAAPRTDTDILTKSDDSEHQQRDHLPRKSAARPSPPK